MHLLGAYFFMCLALGECFKMPQYFFQQEITWFRLLFSYSHCMFTCSVNAHVYIVSKWYSSFQSEQRERLQIPQDVVNFFYKYTLQYRTPENFPCRRKMNTLFVLTTGSGGYKLEAQLRVLLHGCMQHIPPTNGWKSQSKGKI